MTTPKRRILSFVFTVLHLILASFYLFIVRAQAIDRGHGSQNALGFFFCIMFPPLENGEIAQ